MEQQIARLREIFAGGIGNEFQMQERWNETGGDTSSGYYSPYATNARLLDLLNQHGLASKTSLDGPGALGTLGTLDPRSVQKRTGVVGEFGIPIGDQWRTVGSDEFNPGSGWQAGPIQWGSPTGYTYTLDAMTNPDRNDKQGAYSLVFNPDGSLKDVTWQNYEMSKGFLGDNMSWLGPLLVGGAAGLGALVGGGAGGAAGGAAAASGAAPISASTPSWISGVGSTAGMTASEIAAATSSLGSGMGIGATGSAAITPLGAIPSAVVKPLVGGAASAGGGVLQNLLSGGGKLLNKLGDSSNLAALYNAYTQRQQGGDMQDWAERLYGDRKQFLDRLAQSYEDPSSYLEGPEYQRMADIELDRLMRKDAARGRLGTDVERQKLMQDYALSHLKDYRSGLAGAAGLTGTDGVAELDIAGGANKRGFLNALFSQAARGAQQPAQQPQNFNVIDFLSNILDLGDLFA